jgi:hypothetical protein
VATVFTGAAAAATAFAPAAGAATGAAGAVAMVTPDTTARNCGSTMTTSLVLWYSTKEHHASPACIYGKGKITIGDGGARFAYYCAGIHSGYLWINHVRHDFTLGSHHPLYNQNVSAVQITRSSGSSFCNTIH